MVAHVELFVKCSAIEDRFDAFKTLTGITSLFYKSQNLSTLFGICSLTSKPLIQPSGKDPISPSIKVWLFTSSVAFVKQAILG